MDIDTQSPQIISLSKHAISTVANINEHAMRHLYREPLTNVYVIPTQRSYEIVADKRCFRSVGTKTEFEENKFGCITKHCPSILGVLVNENNILTNIRMINDQHIDECCEWDPTGAIFNQIKYQIEMECENNNKFDAAKYMIKLVEIIEIISENMKGMYPYIWVIFLILDR